eukprot:753374-Hanusia_phi.AAC.7
MERNKAWGASTCIPGGWVFYNCFRNSVRGGVVPGGHRPGDGLSLDRIGQWARRPGEYGPGPGIGLPGPALAR